MTLRTPTWWPTASPLTSAARRAPTATPSRTTRAEAEFDIDTRNPTVTVDIVDGALNDSDNQLGRDLHVQRGAGWLHGSRHFSSRGAVAGPAGHVDPRALHRDLHRDRRLLRHRHGVGAARLHDADRNPASATTDTVAIDTVNPSVTDVTATTR